jgi:hypothetical protein
MVGTPVSLTTSGFGAQPAKRASTAKTAHTDTSDFFICFLCLLWVYKNRRIVTVYTVRVNKIAVFMQKSEQITHKKRIKTHNNACAVKKGRRRFQQRPRPRLGRNAQAMAPMPRMAAGQSGRTAGGRSRPDTSAKAREPAARLQQHNGPDAQPDE